MSLQPQFLKGPLDGYYVGKALYAMNIVIVQVSLEAILLVQFPPVSRVSIKALDLVPLRTKHLSSLEKHTQGTQSTVTHMA